MEPGRVELPSVLAPNFPIVHRFSHADPCGGIDELFLIQRVPDQILGKAPIWEGNLQHPLWLSVTFNGVTSQISRSIYRSLGSDRGCFTSKGYDVVRIYFFVSWFTRGDTLSTCIIEELLLKRRNPYGPVISREIFSDESHCKMFLRDVAMY